MSVFSNPSSRSIEGAHAYSSAVIALAGDEPPLHVLRRTPAALEGLVGPLSDQARARTEGAGKWSVRQVVQHLADAELVWGVRVRMTLAHDRPAITGYDQDLWADRLDYAHADDHAALALFRALRLANLALVERQPPEALARVGVHAERGEETVEKMLRLNAGHDVLHLRQVERIIRSFDHAGGRAAAPSSVEIRPLESDDWPAVKKIYLAGIATGHATFETEAPTWEAWSSARLPDCRFVAVDDRAGIVGWAALSPVSGRCVYAGVAEVSVYVAPEAWGRGIGRALLSALVTASEASGIWTLQAGIFPENVASLAVHRRCGFRDVGRRERLGQMHGQWRDVLLLERRKSESLKV